MYCFDDYRLDPSTLHIFRGDTRLDASPQAVEVLAYLVEHSHRTVSRQELVEHFWSRAGTGADAALNTCIRRIRALLDDNADEPRYVQTRPRSGYRFVGSLLTEQAVPAEPPVPCEQPILAQQPSSTDRRLPAAALGVAFVVMLLAGWVWIHAGLQPAAHQRIVVEPVKGLCDHTLFPKFNAGLRESLLVATASRLPKGYDIVEPGLKAHFLVRSTVRQTPDWTVVTLTLIRVRDGVMIWSEEITEPTNMDNYVPVQHALAKRMAISSSRALEASAKRPVR